MELITILAISNGIQYLYKFVKIGLFYYSSVEIANKINVKETIRHLDNINTLYDASTFLLACNKPTNKNKNKKNIYPNNRKRKMSKVYKSISSLAHYFYVKRLERDERNAEKRREYLYEEKKKREKSQDELKEKELFEIGYLRDKLSRHYISPDKLLCDITAGILKNMNGDKYTEADKANVRRLIQDASSESEFDKYEDLFYYVEVLDRITKRPFECVLLNDVVYSPKTILMLQEKKRKMIYHNKAVIEHENKCVD